MAKLIRMIRGDEFPAPHQADVHPDEASNYLAGGWVIDTPAADDVAVKPSAKAKKPALSGTKKPALSGTEGPDLSGAEGPDLSGAEG